MTPAPFYPLVAEDKVSETPIGFDLSSDHVSEHEWGIKRLKQVFGIVNPEYGVSAKLKTKGAAARTISIVPRALTLVFTAKSKKETKSRILYYDVNYGEVSGIPQHVLSATTSYGASEISAAWDEKSFAVRCQEKWYELLQELYEAFERKDVVIWQGGQGPFNNGGLILAVASKLPEYSRKVWIESDEEHNQLILDSSSTGIETKLKAAKREFYALSPRRLSGDRTSKYDVMYWLNPMEQRANNCGYFTVEELEQWIEGKGPVPMQKKANG